MGNSRTRKKVKRVAPRPANAPKLLDDTQHFRVAISRIKLKPDHVPEPRFTHVEEKPLMSDAEADAILARNVKGYVAPTPKMTDGDLGVEHRSAPPVGATGHKHPGAELKPVMDGEATLADVRPDAPKPETPQPPMCRYKPSAPDDEGWGESAYAVAYWLVTRLGGGCLVGIGIVIGMREAVRWSFG